MPQYIKRFENALSDSLCDRLIKKFLEDKRVSPDPQPSYSKRDYIYASDKAEWQNLVREVSLVEQRLTLQYFTEVGALIHEWFDDGYVLARYKKGDTCILHNDNQSVQPPHNHLRYATLLFYLNSVEEGGETYFPKQNVKVKPKKGMAVMFPAQLTHPHEVLAPQSDRFIFQTWIVDTNMVVNYKNDF